MSWLKEVTSLQGCPCSGFNPMVDIPTSFNDMLCPGEPVTRSGYLPFHEYGRTVVTSRFQQLRDVLTYRNCSAMKLTNDEMSTGAYAWIICSDPSMDCYKLLRTVNLTGTGGEDFGVSNQSKYLTSKTKARVGFQVLVPYIHITLNANI